MLPAEFVLSVDDAKSIVDAIANPGGVSTERLQSVCDQLQKEGVFLDAASAGRKFLIRVLPTRYQRIGFSVSELTDWLYRKLGNTPDRWLMDERLHEEVEEFVKQGYNTHVRKKAAEKVNGLSDAEAKLLLLKLVDQIPAAGLSVME